MDFILNEAASLLKKYKTRNPFELADCLNITVLYRPLGNLKGLYIYSRLSRYICINDSLDEHLQRLVCTHEIGHDRFHRHLARINPQAQELISYDMSSKPKREQPYLQQKSYCLIMPLLKCLMLNAEDMNFFRIAKEFEVPPELMDFKFQILKKQGVQA